MTIKNKDIYDKLEPINYYLFTQLLLRTGAVTAEASNNLINFVDDVTS